MASNSKSKARGQANKARADARFEKMLTGIRKTLKNEELCPHYVGGGQSITRPIAK